MDTTTIKVNKSKAQNDRKLITIGREVNRYSVIICAILMIIFEILTFQSFITYTAYDNSTASVWSFCFFNISNEYIVYLLIPIFQIICIYYITMINSHACIRMTKLNSRKELFKKLIISNGLISFLGSCWVFLSMFLVGICGGLSVDIDFNNDMAQDIFMTLGCKESNVFIFMLFMIIAFFIYLFVVGLIYSVVYYLTLKSMWAYIITFAMLYLNMRLRYNGMFKILMFQSNFYFSKWIVCDTGGKVFCILFWMINIVVLMCILRYCIFKKDLVLKNKRK